MQLSGPDLVHLFEALTVGRVFSHQAAVVGPFVEDYINSAFPRIDDIAWPCMAPRTIYLVSCRNAAHQRAHFSIFVPSAADPEVGTRIHAVGAPMAGYTLEFNRNYSPAASNQP